MRSLAVRREGTVAYAEALRLQEALVGRRRAGEIPDTLLLLEHPHVITLGSSSDPAHVRVGTEERRGLDLELFDVGRGGDVTYHGPGQLVAYPILDLKPDRRDLHAYLRDLEEVAIRLAGRFDVEAARREGATGVWASGGKLAAIGVRVSSQWITSHGMAVNVGTDLTYFETIVPCGLDDERVTSLERELGRPVDIDLVAERLTDTFAETFGRNILVG